jgi:hypothetical protein
MIFMFILLCDFFVILEYDEMNYNFVSGFLYIVFKIIDLGYMK